MGSDKTEKKRLKTQIKLEKTQTKSVLLQTDKASPALKFAEAVRGILYLLGSASLVLAVILQEKGVWITLDEIVENLLVIRRSRWC